MNRSRLAKLNLNIDNIDKAEIGEVKVVKTWYSPDGYLFDDKDEYVDYMLNEFQYVLSVTAILAIRDNADYLSYEEFVSHVQADEKIQKNYKEFVDDAGDMYSDYTLKDFISDDAFTDYVAENNNELADDLEVGLTRTTGWHKNGPEYLLEGTWTALHAFCEKACGEDGEAGEELYRYTRALEKLKDRIFNFVGESSVKESGHARIVEDSDKQILSSVDGTQFTVFLRDSGDGNLGCQYYFGASLKEAKTIFEHMCKEANALQFSEETYWLELWAISTSPEILTQDVKDDINKIRACVERDTNAQKSRDAEHALDDLSARGLATQIDTYHY